MKAFWQQCEGQFIDSFPLRQYLGGDEDHGVFLTEYGEAPPRKAAIKLTYADPDSTETKLRIWKQAADLSHPNLVSLFESGTGQLNEVPLLYLVMEYADEDLSQVIPERPLTTIEAKQAVDPALEALTYLHAQGFVHGRLKLSNFMAVDGRLKISSDGITPIGPGSSTPEDDVHSLGMTLVEMLTQRRREPELPETLPPEFREVIRNTLSQDPQKRWTVAEAKQALRGQPVQRHQRKNYAASLGTAAIVVLLILVAGTLLLRHRETASVVVPNPAPPPVRTPEPSTAKVEPEPIPKDSPREEIIQRELPEVLAQARNSIQGRVAVAVRVEVDPSGKVSTATLESAGPSKYFAGRALEAARRWKFVPAEGARAWILRFEFTRPGTKVTPVKALP